MTKQFGRTTLAGMCIAVAAVMLSSNSTNAQAVGSSVVSHAFVPAVGFFNSDFSELVTASVISTGSGPVLYYNVYDFGGGFSAGGFGAIPASSFKVSGGTVNTGTVTATLNVNTCDIAGFTTNYGPCGAIAITWVEVPASVGGSYATRGDTVQTFPGGGTIETNGTTQVFNAMATGTELGFDLPPGTTGQLTKETNVTVTINLP